jgi:hypothetical protein
MVEPSFLYFDNACFGVLEEGLEKKYAASEETGYFSTGE